MDEEVIKNGIVGNLVGYKIGGKTYTVDGEIIDDVHDEECFCCRKVLFSGQSVENPFD